MRNKLKRVFEAGDSNGDGTLSRREFWVLLESPTMLQYLSVLGVEVHEVESLFDLLDDGDGLITMAEFEKGLVRLRGPATAIDVVAMMHDTFVIQEQNRTLLKAISNLESAQASHAGLV